MKALAVALILGGLVLMLAAVCAVAHSWYDPWCCNGDDCKQIGPDEVVAGPKGFQVKGRWFVPYGDPSIRQSQDGDYHACEYPKGTLRCFYVPAGGV